MTVEADTARSFRKAASELVCDNSNVLPHEVGFHRYGTGDGSKILLSDDKLKGRRTILVQWREQTMLRQLRIVDPIGIGRVDEVGSTAMSLMAIADALDTFVSQPKRAADGKLLSMCAAVASVQGHLDGTTSVAGQVRIWAATAVSAPSMSMGRRHARLNEFLSRLLHDGERREDPTRPGYRTTRASMILLTPITSQIGERFELRGIMDVTSFQSGGGAMEAMRQTNLARSLAHPTRRPGIIIDEALRIAGA